MSAEATTPPVYPPHQPDQHGRRESAPPGDDPVSHDQVSADQVGDTSEQTEPDDETAPTFELFGKPVVAMEPGQFRLPEVHRHIQAGRVVLLLPARRSPHPPPPRRPQPESPPTADPTAT